MIKQIALFLLFVLAALPARAGSNASEWVQAMYSAMRLVDGGMADNGGTERLIGVHITLKKNWKTYWRYPGDSGVPPSFDWSGSDNVASVDIRWPAPARFYDGYSHTVGYKDEVVFPVRVTPKDPAKPVVIRLDLDYAVCEDLCIFAEGKAELALSDEVSTASRLRIDGFNSTVPVAAGNGTGITGHSRNASAKPQTVTISAVFPHGAERAELYVEGPPEWYTPLPERKKLLDPKMAEFEIVLDGLPNDAVVAGTRLRVTGVTETYAFEQWIELQ